MKVNILNEVVDIQFNMAVELAYEEITDEAFDIDSLKKAKNSLALCMAAIIANNEDTQITIDRLMKEANGKEIAALNSAIITAMIEWLKIPAVITKEEAKDEQPDVNDEEEQAKN